MTQDELDDVVWWATENNVPAILEAALIKGGDAETYEPGFDSPANFIAVFWWHLECIKVFLKYSGPEYKEFLRGFCRDEVLEEFLDDE